jgi:hypothetical protein
LISGPEGAPDEADAVAHRAVVDQIFLRNAALAQCELLFQAHCDTQHVDFILAMVLDQVIVGSKIAKTKIVSDRSADLRLQAA